MDLIGKEGIAHFHFIVDPDNKFGKLIKCDFCGYIAETYAESCPFCHRRFVDKDNKAYVPNEESEEN